MNTILYRNLANAIVVARVILIFIVIALFESPSSVSRMMALGLLVIAALSDWFDGYVAEKCKIVTVVGGMMDTLGDRLTENLLFIFFACKQAIPVYVPLFFVTRSFLADFIRSLNFQKGMTTFGFHASVWGKRLVSSRTSRALYLCMKFTVFLLAAFWLMACSMETVFTTELTEKVREAAGLLALAAVIFSFVRFVLLVFDSREALRESFGK
ncbi:MAG: CDP-alcohol phosphatidyltransferase family protein [Candidatus Omnitrophota bacterium]